MTNVYCVIIGFSHKTNYVKNKLIFSTNDNFVEVKNINPYLVEGPDVIVREARKSLSDMPKMMKGNQPTEGGNLLLSQKEKEELLHKDPSANQWIKKFMGAREFIQGKERYCLWFADADMKEVRNHPLLMKRIENVREMRLASRDAVTRKKAETPWLFRETNNPERSLVIPSNVHMAWMRAVAGRLKTDYRYSAFIVYNTFPFPNLNQELKTKLEKTAKDILNARELYPDWSMADLYDDIVMPSELRKAHQNNDKAVMEAYGMPVGKTTEAEAITWLFKMYDERR